MEDSHTQITRSGIYAYSPKVPQDTINLVARARGWAERATIWVIAAAFIMVLVTYFILIAPADVDLLLYALAAVAGVLMAVLGYKMILRPLIVRAHLVRDKLAIFLPSGNAATDIYEQQVVRLKHVPADRVDMLRDLLIRELRVMLLGDARIGRLIGEGFGPGDGEYDEMAERVARAESDITDAVNFYVSESD